MALTRASVGNYYNTGRPEKGMVYERPPAPLSTDADHHTGRQWHVCAVCRESWLCAAQDERHGHPGCPGAPYVFRPHRKPLPADWPGEEGAATTEEVSG